MLLDIHTEGSAEQRPCSLGLAVAPRSKDLGRGTFMTCSSSSDHIRLSLIFLIKQDPTGHGSGFRRHGGRSLAVSSGHPRALLSSPTPSTSCISSRTGTSSSSPIPASTRVWPTTSTWRPRLVSSRFAPPRLVSLGHRHAEGSVPCARSALRTRHRDIPLGARGGDRGLPSPRHG